MAIVGDAPDAFDYILAGNKSYSTRLHSDNPNLLHRLSAGQSPPILWIGCADSRVPETTICSSEPGEIFVHRNIANVLHPYDVSAQSVIEYAVGVLGVQRIVVCGHTKCGGATAALGDADLGEALNSWLAPVRDVRRKYESQIASVESTEERANLLAELNVRQGLQMLRKNPTVMKAITERGLKLHGVLYDIPAAELRVLEDVKTPGLWTPNGNSHGEEPRSVNR